MNPLVIPRTILCLFLCFPAFSQWTQTKGPTSAITNEIYQINSFLFVNGETGGVFRSPDDGLTWEAVNHGLPNYPHCYAMAADKSVLYAAIATHGIFVSVNQGDSWSRLSSELNGKTFYSLKVSGLSIYAGLSEGGLYYSANGGSAWSYFSGPSPSPQIRDFEIVGEKLWIGADALYYSMNNGSTWTKVNAAIGPNGVSAISYSGNLLYVGAYDVQHSSALFISSDMGVSWKKEGTYGGTITALFSEGQEIYMAVAASQLYYSANGGAAWEYKNFPVPHVIIKYLFRTGGTLYASTTEGVFASADNGTTWVRRREGIINHIVKHLAVYHDKIIASTERQGVYISSDQGGSWTQNHAGLDARAGLSVSGIYVSGNKVFVGTGTGVYASSDGGDLWHQKLSTAVNENVHSLHGSQSRLIATTGKGCYVSHDQGETWALKGATTLHDRHLMTVRVQGDTIITATYNEIFISRDAGQSWHVRTLPTAFYTPTDVLFYGPALLVATYQGLYMSSTLGDSWTQVKGLPLPVVDLAANDTLLFAGTGNGLFVSADVGGSWIPANENLDNQDVYSLIDDGAFYYAGTYGTSVWRIPVSGLVTPCKVPRPKTPVIVENCGVLDISNFEAGTVEWYSDGATTGLSGTSIRVTQSGTYSVRLSNECGSVTSNAIHFDAARIPSLDAKPVIGQHCDALTLENPDAREIIWYKNGVRVPNASADTLRVTQPGTYTVELKGPCGSSVSDPVYQEGKSKIEMYNVITPDGDGYNDAYRLAGALTGSSIQIFNRWGQLVYENTHYDDTWAAAGLSYGIYYYVVRNPCYGVIKGSFTVL